MSRIERMVLADRLTSLVERVGQVQELVEYARAYGRTFDRTEGKEVAAEIRKAKHALVDVILDYPCVLDEAAQLLRDLQSEPSENIRQTVRL